MVSKIVFSIILFCSTKIPKDMKSETHYDPQECVDCPDINKDITFNLYTKSDRYHKHILRPNDDSTLIGSPFNSQHRTIIIIHGLTGDIETETSQSTKNALLEKGEYNVILVDWGKLSNKSDESDHCEVITRMPVTGTYVAQLIIWLEKTFSISRSTFHMIGFSLGAHISGLTGEALARNDPNKIKIGRITGLDPAGRGFEVSNGLDKTDATFVDIIHTNTDDYGIKKSIGHVDFYVNHGYQQPGCTIQNDECNHMRAWELFSQSISKTYAFPAFRCKRADSWKTARSSIWRLKKPLSNCEDFEYDYMGFVINPKTVGNFTVFTNKYPPYGNFLNIAPPESFEDSDESGCDDEDIVNGTNAVVIS